jgi:hypothetical protein
MVSASHPPPMRPGGGPPPPTVAVVSAATIRGARDANFVHTLYGAESG